MNFFSNSDSNLNNENHHYFIGHMLSDMSNIKALKKVQKKLKTKYGLKNYHWNNKLFGNLIYLGYFTEKDAENYMNNIFSKLLKEISIKFNEIECNYTELTVNYDKSYYNISINFSDENRYLEDIIIPYLYEMGIMPIYDRKKNKNSPSVNLMYYKESRVVIDKKDKINIQIPDIKFKIDGLSLLRGTPIHHRSGHPSLHDQMNIEEVKKFNFPLNGSV